MNITEYMNLQKDRKIYLHYINRKTTHILEDECKYLMHNKTEKWHEPLKSLFLEMLLNPFDNVAIQMQAEMKSKELSKTFIGWLLSFILTQKMLVGDLLEEDYNATFSEIKNKRKFHIDFLKKYEAYYGICGNKNIEFIYLEVSYHGFLNIPICLESGLALYYFSNLHASYYSK